MNYWYLFGFLIFLPNMAYAQTTINVTSTEPCFLNYTAGVHMWENCGFDQDYLTFSLMGWQWITGGNFTLVLVSVIMFGSYMKYHKMMYPILIGVMFLPLSYFVFPAVFLSWAFLMAFIGIGIGVWYAIYKQTKEY